METLPLNPTTEQLRRAVRRLQDTTAISGSFTLSETTSTVVPAFRITETSAVAITPTNAAAAQAMASGVVWVECQRNQFVVHHSANAVSRSFTYMVTL